MQATKINTFTGRSDDLDAAIGEAQESAQQLLTNLNPSEIVTVQAQTVVYAGKDGGYNYVRFMHIITVVYE